MVRSAQECSHAAHESILFIHPVAVNIEHPNFFSHKLTIEIPASVVNAWYDFAAEHQKIATTTKGFNRGQVPKEYIKNYYLQTLVNHVKDGIFTYAIINYLFAALHDHQLVMTGDPRIIAIDVEPNKKGLFTFEISTINNITIEEWKYLPFKAPKRKNYKDIDRQVESFIKEEKEFLSSCTNDEIQPNDWVYFDLIIYNKHNKPLTADISHSFWLKVGSHETDGPLRELFLNKKVGDQFVSYNPGLQDYFSTQVETQYAYLVTIKAVVPDRYVSLDLLKKHFKLKTYRDVHVKLIEVFSFRNDISQRRSTIEEALKLVLSKNKFDIPNHLILRRQKAILEEIKHNPDYNVYRMQKDFQYYIRQLAEKQIKEEILIDHIAYADKISIDTNDVIYYLNLYNRARTREFIYFKLPEFKSHGKDVPISSEEIKHYCLREKTLNHIIYHLTKK